MNVSVMNVKFDNPKRNKILSFVEEKGQVSKSELLEFLSKMNEEEGTNVGWQYVRANSYFFKVRESKETGEKMICLSKIGSKVLEKTRVNESATFEEVVSDTYPSLSDILIKVIANRNGIDLSLYDMDQIKLGMAMTLENNGGAAENGQFDLFGIDMNQIFMVVIGNLTNDKNYYLKVKTSEIDSTWPNNCGDDDFPTDVPAEAFNKLFAEPGPDKDSTDGEDDTDTDTDNTLLDDILDNENVEESEGADLTVDNTLERIAKAHLVRKERLIKEYELGLSIEMKEISDEKRAKEKVLENIAQCTTYYSDYAKLHWDTLTDREKKLAQELSKFAPSEPAFVFPFPENPTHDADDEDKEKDITTQNVDGGEKASVPGSDAIAEPTSSGDKEGNALAFGKEVGDDSPVEKEEWEPENTGDEQVLLDDENRKTLLSKEQQIEIKEYMKKHGRPSNEKMEEFANKFKIKVSTLKAYIYTVDDIKESYEIGKRYTVDGVTGVVIAISESHLVMSQRGKMVLVEKQDKDEFDGGDDLEDYSEEEDKGEIVLGTKSDFNDKLEMNLQSIPQNAGLTPQPVYARKAAGPSNFMHNTLQQGPKRDKSRKF